MSLLIAVLVCLQQEEPPPPPAPTATSEPTWLDSVHGTIRLRHRARWTGDHSDSDLVNTIQVRAGDAEEDLFSGAASGRFASDVDGDRRTEGFSPFDSLPDTYRRAVTAQVHTAYLDIANPWPGVRARAGRQVLEELPEALPLDGARIAVDASPETTVAIFGGRPVNHFESSPSGDWMFGAWIEVRPWTRGRARIEYLHLEDENTFGLFRDDLAALMIEHGEGPWLFSGRATMLESEARDVLLRGSVAVPEEGLTFDLRAYYLFEQQQALSYGLDAFAVFLLPVEPYYQVSISGSVELSAEFGLDAAVTARQLEDSGAEGAYNHEFTRWGATGRYSLSKELSFGATGDFWQTRDDDFWTAGGFLAWQVADAWRADVSSTYTLYSIDALTGEERERVRSLTLAVRWKARENVSADARAAIEENDVDRFQTVDIGVRYVF